MKRLPVMLMLILILFFASGCSVAELPLLQQPAVTAPGGGYAADAAPQRLAPEATPQPSARPGRAPVAAAAQTEMNLAVQPDESPSGKEAVEQSGGKSAKPDSALDDTVRRTIDALAQQQTYAEWKGARWDVYPLGPGTHSWVVLLTKNDAEVGYLVISTTEDGRLVVTEYGTGSKPLFSLQTLYRTLVQQELIADHTSQELFMNEAVIRKQRLYGGPLQSAWQISIANDNFYFDAKSGERLPDISAASELKDAAMTGDDDKRLMKPLSDTKRIVKDSEQAPAIADFRYVPSSDPFDNVSWMAGKALPIKQAEDLAEALTPDAPIVYIAKLYGGKATYALAVTGLHVWTDGRAFVMLDHDGSRFVPFEALTARGSFKRLAGD